MSHGRIYGLYLRHNSHAHDIISGTHEYSTPRCMLWNAWLAEALLRSVTSNRSRTALRKGMVCHHGNMSCNDHISRGGGRLVFGHVCLPVDREGVGLDWRRTGRNSGAAATIESALVPCSTLCLPYHFEPIRHFHASIFHQHCPTPRAAQHDGYVRFRICRSYYYLYFYCGSLHDISP